MFKPDVISLLAHLREERVKTKTPNVSDTTGEYLYDLICERQYRRILELGTANGYSTIYLAEAALQIDGHVLTVEAKHPVYLQARNNLALYRHCVTQVHADAREFCKTLSRETFDFAFIDAGKKETLAYLTIVWPRVADDGVIIVDDVVKFGEKMEWFYEFLREKGITYEIIMTDPDDGIMRIEKSSNLWVAI